jgi:magnesium-transporting ATPase (P-type)
MALSFNTVLTSLPVFALGLVERDISPSDRLVGFGNVSARKLAQSYPKLYMTGRQNRMFSISAIGNMFIVALLMGIWVYLVALMPLNDMGAVNEHGKVLDHWGMSWVFFVSVFSIDTIAVVLISDGITAIMVWAVLYSFAVCATYFVSDIFDPANQSGDILEVLVAGTWTIWPVVSLAALPPIMILIAAKSWIYRFNPTARMIWQEAKRRADVRRSIKRRLGQSKNSFITKQLIKRNKSILEQPASAIYQPDRLEEGIRLLSK